ncbi:hypothetical protein A3F06_03685 [candidate division TM6 bacterium RIFCSPHIGHO2_12_FULL_36_22]|nr:MAG: hypothetical protein A3F06_03685 [candidate division TM6 bacterium RIFCSPHIGHO2_12_FULL_36_22]
MKINNLFLYLILSSCFIETSRTEDFDFSKTINQESDFSLEVTSGVSKCTTLTFDPEDTSPGYLYNVYRYRDGEIIQIGSTISAKKHTIYNNPTIHPKNTENFKLTGDSKTNIQMGDIIILDGWKEPDSHEGETNHYTSDTTRQQFCFHIRTLPKKCVLYISEQGVTDVPSIELTAGFNFTTGLTDCSPAQYKALQEFLKKQNEKPTKKS